ncbi:MAG: DUF4139 domain-containing protein [Leptospirales bacterium]|nr:DUF4139 domain-containing protein [Leptospirales bacterium]
MKKILIIIILLSMVTIPELRITAKSVTVGSEIKSVKLYTNRAEITRISRIKLNKGLNIVEVEGLPDNLQDWSVRGALPEKFDAKILSMEISRQALLEKRNKKIMEIEKKLEELKDRDTELSDELANIIAQEEFLNSINDFAKISASKELVTKLPQTDVWGNTIDFTSNKRKAAQSAKRSILKKRKDLAAEIQKWEFELSQAGGRSYYTNYKALNMAVEKNAITPQTQQYGELSDKYAQQREFLEKNTSQLDTEKRILLNIFSADAGETDFNFTYMVPNTYWNMKYDFRASKKRDEIEIILYSDIYQKTGEDWDNINLTLSTGAPQNSIILPPIYPWYLSVMREDYRGANKEELYSARQKSAVMDSEVMYESAEEDTDKMVIPESTITESGFNFEIALPLKQSIESSEKYQKKLIKSYIIKSGRGLQYYYQTVPGSSSQVFLMAKATNQTELPWLRGEAQVFLENEFMGKVNIPNTPVTKENEIVLGMVPDISSKKELVRKYDDTAGLFGGNQRVVYSYKITVESNSKESREIIVVDNFPVSTTEDVKVEIKDLSDQFKRDDETAKSTEFAQGIRRFVINLPPGAKKEITYNAVITYDKELRINGLR